MLVKGVPVEYMEFVQYVKYVSNIKHAAEGFLWLPGLDWLWSTYPMSSRAYIH